MQGLEFPFSDDVQYLIACVLGSCVRAIHDRATPITARGILKRISDIICGTATAWYLGPVMVAALPERFAESLGPAAYFIIGYVAAEVCGFLVTIFTEILPSFARAWAAMRSGIITGPARGPKQGDQP